MLANSALAGREDEIRERGWVKVDLGQGPTPHADGGFGTISRRATIGARYEPSGEVADAGLAERFPLALITPKTHLFLNSTFANQKRQHSAQPSPEVVIHPDDARERGIEDGARVRVPQRPRRVLLCRAGVGRRPSGGGGGPDGLVEPGLPGRQEQPGHHVAGAHRRGQRTGVQRQPRASWPRTPPASGAGPGPPSPKGSAPPPRPGASARYASAAARPAERPGTPPPDRHEVPTHGACPPRRGRPPPPPGEPTPPRPPTARRGRP